MDYQDDESEGNGRNNQGGEDADFYHIESQMKEHEEELAVLKKYDPSEGGESSTQQKNMDEFESFHEQSEHNLPPP